MLCAIAYVAVVVGRIPLVLFLKYDPKDIMIALSGLMEDVVKLLLPAFPPFNLIKGGLNTAITMLLYKPVITTLRHSNLIEPNKATEKACINIGVILVALLIITTCILLILSLKGIF